MENPGCNISRRVHQLCPHAAVSVPLVLLPRSPGEARHLSRQAGNEMISSLSPSMHLLIMGVATLVHSNYRIFKIGPCVAICVVVCGEDGAIKLASLMRVTL